MQPAPNAYNGYQDDPTDPQHAAWHSLIGHFVGQHLKGESPPLDVFEVLAAIVAAERVFLKIRRWPGDIEFHVGGHRKGMYCMCRRPDRGFQVAGDKFILLGRSQRAVGEVLDVLAPHYDPTQLADLKDRLTAPRGEVLKGRR